MVSLDAVWPSACGKPSRAILAAPNRVCAETLHHERDKYNTVALKYGLATTM